jgi:AcrR family transcriptional regulator
MSDEKRPYRMTKRAELEAETRRRITESAVELHGTLGPARTTISALAEHAGVQRATVYRHFPDDAALFAACSSHWGAQNPPPDLAAWAAVEDPNERLHNALGELYGYYRRTENMWTNLLRDEASLSILTELLDGFRQYLGAARETLVAGRASEWPAQRLVRAAMGHALAFQTWRSLAMEQGLEDEEAVRLMIGFVTVAQAAPAA